MNRSIRRHNGTPATGQPIKSGGGDWPFNIPLPKELKTRGVVLVDQVQAVHRVSCVFRRIESAPDKLLIDVRIMLCGILGIDLAAMPGLSDNA